MKNLSILLVMALLLTVNLLAVALKRAGVLPMDQQTHVTTAQQHHR